MPPAASSTVRQSTTAPKPDLSDRKTFIYLQEVNARVNLARDTWITYGHLASVAYSQACTEMQVTLKKIKEEYERVAKLNELIADLALTVLTVGVAGPIAATAVKLAAGAKVSAGFKKAAEAAKTAGRSGEAVERIEKFGEKVGEAVKDSAADLTKKGLDKAAEALKPPAVKDAFEGPRVPPERYGEQIQANIGARLMVLDANVISRLDNLMERSADLSLDQAQRLFEPILASSFVKDPPAIKLTPEGAIADTSLQNKLTAAASIALWLAWAWGRDLAYWSQPWHNDINYYYNEFMQHGGGGPPHPNEEPIHFDHLYRKLAQLGIPLVPISQFYYGKDSKGAFTDGSPHLNMMGFIQWSFSPDALRILLANVPRHPLGQQYAEMQARKSFIEAFLRKIGYIADDSDD